MKEKTTDINQTNEFEEKKEYPALVKRIKAAITDSIIIIIFMFVISDVFSSLESVPKEARMVAFLFIFILYDPICTSFFGGTIGHKIVGIRVKRESNEQRNISFSLAIIRFIIKALLGWISFLTIGANIKRMAIHDIVVKSVVVNEEETNNNTK